MKENSTKNNNINYIHYLQYTEVILLEKQINSSTIAFLLTYSASNITYLSGHGQRLIHYCCEGNCDYLTFRSQKFYLNIITYIHTRNYQTFFRYHFQTLKCNEHIHV